MYGSVLPLLRGPDSVAARALLLTFAPTVPCPTLLQATTPETMVVGQIDFGDYVGGECLFIPSKPDDDVAGGVGEEDDGFLATFVSPRDGGHSGRQRATSMCYLLCMLRRTAWGQHADVGLAQEAQPWGCSVMCRLACVSMI